MKKRKLSEIEAVLQAPFWLARDLVQFSKPWAKSFRERAVEAVGVIVVAFVFVAQVALWTIWDALFDGDRGGR